ncbi:hypothetical protein D0Z08_05845 [Nocardioides immobilis]|uniref:Uncharacterized protein n=1 Tax=Nocardioides immobilis TaxID=2049295 RepID=A0A417Y5A1_9ACTN|nr:hypothetical protein [Nocardioides immobilis]RHW27819.1 hypothetical protein D0Z08_05845 [Nocardioides immobilis]
MDEQTRERLYAARDEWRDAMDAYREQADKHVLMWWGDRPPPKLDLQPVTHEAIKRLEALREEEQSRKDAYYALARELGLAE